MTVMQTIAADRFAVALNGIFSNVESQLTTNLDEPVEEACKAAKKSLRKKGQPYRDRPTKKGLYRTGFNHRVNKKGKYEAVGYVGNSRKPGLVHLLEKGHATMRGGRTRAFEHMRPAAEIGERVLLEEAEKLVDEALR